MSSAMAWSGSSLRDLGDEVAGSGFLGVDGDPLRPPSQSDLDHAYGPRGEPTRQDAPQLGVIRGVLIQQHHPLHVDLLAGDALREPDDRPVGPVGEDLRFGRHVLDVHVSRHDPEPTVVEAVSGFAGVPPHRGDPAQLGELLERDSLLDQVRVGDIKALGKRRHCHNFPRTAILRSAKVRSRCRTRSVETDILMGQVAAPPPWISWTVAPARSPPWSGPRDVHPPRRARLAWC